MSIGLNSKSRRLGSPHSRGFTIIEAMYTLTIFAILSAFAVPYMYSMIESNTLRAAEGELSSSLRLARSEAMARGKHVSICASADGSACEGVASTDWHLGWMVFQDEGTAGTKDGDDVVIKVHESLGMSMTLRYIDDASSPRGYIRFRKRTGILFDEAWAGAFRLCTSGADINDARSLGVLSMGRVAQITTTACP